MDRSQIRKERIVVRVGDESVVQEVFVDEETGLDVDEHNGTFRTRDETETLVRTVFQIGAAAMPSELERYNKWLKGSSPVDVFQKRATTLNSTPLKHSTASPASSSADSRFDLATQKKNDGNEALSSGDARRALRCYREALRIVEGFPRGAASCESLAVTLYSNSSQAHIQLSRYEAAVQDCAAALALSPTHVKTLFRLGVGLCCLGRYRDAEMEVLARLRSIGSLDAASALEQLASKGFASASIAHCKGARLIRGRWHWQLESDAAAGDLVTTLPFVPWRDQWFDVDGIPSTSFAEDFSEGTQYALVVRTYLASLQLKAPPSPLPTTANVQRIRQLYTVVLSSTCISDASRAVSISCAIVTLVLFGVLECANELRNLVETPLSATNGERRVYFGRAALTAAKGDGVEANFNIDSGAVSTVRAASCGDILWVAL